jgi:GT2 family glycosyltransferase
MTTPPPTPSSPPADRPTVVAVVVAHHGTRWLPGLQAALAAQTRAPDVVVAADTSAADDGNQTLAALVDWLGAGRVVDLPARSGFGAAVQAALDRAGRPTTGSSFLWLLHDDCAPAPDALEQLLAETARDPQVAVAGPKVLGLGDRRLLLEAGVTIARSGRRETGLERREQDQGQHDGTRAVLAVGSAGMLVRRDVWDALGGLDRRLPLFRDDVDLGWRANLAGHRVVVVTDAVVRHAEASGHRRRAVHAGGGRTHRLDRQHALFVLLANLTLLRVPGALVRLTLSTLVRALGLLAGKRPAHAADELLALLAVVGRPDRLLSARLARRRTRTQPARSVSALLAPRGSGFRHGMENLSVFLGTRAGDALGGRHRAAVLAGSGSESGPTSEDADDLPSSGAGAVRRVLLQPAVVLTAGLLLLSAVASRALLGQGRLMGGALLPAPAAASGLWHSYLATWHPVGLGGDTSAPSYLAVLALLSNALLGNAERAVDLLLLGAVPLAGLSAYAALRRLATSVPLRLWGSVTYALLPPLVGAVATGRLGTVVVAVLLPMLVLVLLRGLGPAGGPRAWRAAWTGGLLLAVMAAFVPVVWVVATVAAVVVGVVRRPALRRVLPVVLVPPALLLPWLPGLAERPDLLLLEPGLPGPGLSDPRLGGLDLLLLHAGGPGLPPLALGVGLLLAALAGLLRRDRRRVVLLGWLAALVCLAGALAVSRLTVTAPTLEAPVAAWPGALMLLAGAGLVAAAVAGAAGARARVARSSFGWRQPGALVVLVLAAVAPVLTAGWWAVTGADGPLERRDPVLLPAFVAAEGNQPNRPRTLVLRVRDDGRLSYAVLRSDGPRTGDAELAPDVPRGVGLDAAVADLASGRGGDSAGRLVPYGIRFVLLTTPSDRGLVRAIESVPGVVQVSDQDEARLWRIDYQVARLRVLPPGAPVVQDDGAPPPAVVLPAGQVRADTEVPGGADGRLLVLADSANPGWRATLDGTALEPRRYDGWAQAFTLPASGGHLVLDYQPGPRPVLLWIELGVLLLVLVLALPQARTTLDDEDAGAGADLPDTAPAEPAPPATTSPGTGDADGAAAWSSPEEVPS